LKILRHLRWALPIALSLGASALLAQDVPPPPPPPTLNSGDTAFVFACSMFVLLMLLPGLALFYAGLARSKNVLSILMQVFSVTAMLSVLWALYGYSFVFADGGSMQLFIGGASKAFLQNVTPDSLQGTIPEYLYFFFMLLFAAITPPIIVGGFAERMKYSAVMVFMLIWFTINYVPMAHMGWRLGG
jgi:Amt family ammonium transporter